MGARDFGAICDVSILTDRSSFERARQLVCGGDLYLPSATYSWLARDKLIEVRGKTLGYSLVSQFVRDRQLLIVFLPEILDELSRRLLFKIGREIPLTDLRAWMLSAHLGLPLLTFDEKPVEEIREHTGARSLWKLDVHPDWPVLGETLRLYLRLVKEVGCYLSKTLGDEGAFRSMVDVLQREGSNGILTAAAVRRLCRTQPNPGGLNLECLAWDLTPLLREYLEQHVLQPDVLRELCERTLLMVASPNGQGGAIPLHSEVESGNSFSSAGSTGKPSRPHAPQ